MPKRLTQQQVRRIERKVGRQIVAEREPEAREEIIQGRGWASGQQYSVQRTVHRVKFRGSNQWTEVLE